MAFRWQGRTPPRPTPGARRLARGVVRLVTTLALGAGALVPAAAHAQGSAGTPDTARLRRDAERRAREFVQARQAYDAKMRALQAKLQRQLDEQARTMQALDRDLSRSVAADPRVRDSILRAAEPRVAAAAERLTAVQAEIEQVTRRQLERDIADGALPGVAPGSPEARDFAATLALDYARMTRELTTMARTLAAQQASLAWRASSERPRGRMGVTLSGDQEVTLREGRVTTRYRGPQVIESVEPGGPADQAGVEAGDTLVALGRHRLADAEVPLAELLVPGEKLAVRVRRRGQERTLTMVVGERPAQVAGAPRAIFFGTPCVPGEACGPLMVRGGAGAPPPPIPPRPPQSPATNIVAGTTSWSISYDGSMAGAVLATIDADLEDLVGTDEGAFVLRVAPGTPAAEAGLRSGDVIVRADDDAVSSPRDVRRAMQRTAEKGGRSLGLVVVRKGQSRTVQLKW